MLDDNLRVLSRRIHELEIECTEAKERASQAERARQQVEDQLGSVHDRQAKLRIEVEEELREKIEGKERELRRAREALSEAEHRHKGEVETMKLEKTQELELIHEKIRKALQNKKEIIDQLREESALKDVTIDKYREMLDRERKDALLRGTK